MSSVKAEEITIKDMTEEAIKIIFHSNNKDIFTSLIILILILLVLLFILNYMQTILYYFPAGMFMVILILTLGLNMLYVLHKYLSIDKSKTDKQRIPYVALLFLVIIIIITIIATSGFGLISGNQKLCEIFILLLAGLYLFYLFSIIAREKICGPGLLSLFSFLCALPNDKATSSNANIFYELITLIRSSFEQLYENLYNKSMKGIIIILVVILLPPVVIYLISKIG